MSIAEVKNAFRKDTNSPVETPPAHTSTAIRDRKLPEFVGPNKSEWHGQSSAMHYNAQSPDGPRSARDVSKRQAGVDTQFAASQGAARRKQLRLSGKPKRIRR
jgi:hypothetical protein